MTRIAYYTTANLKFHRAHVYNITRTSEELRKQGLKVKVVQSFRDVISTFRNFDILYYRDPRLVAVVLCAKWILRKKVVLELHSAAPNILSRLHWWFALRFTDGIVFFTEALKKYYPAHAHKGPVVRGNTYDPALYEPYRAIPKQELRSALNLPLYGTLLIYTGSTKTYRFDELIEAIKRMSGTYLVIVGATGDAENFVHERVIVRKRVDLTEVARYQLVADILVVPYVSDDPGGFPIKIFEYLGAGRPIVSFVNDSITEVLRNGENALLINPQSVDNWKRAIKNLVNHPERARALAERASADALQYTWSARGEAIAQFIQGVSMS